MDPFPACCVMFVWIVLEDCPSFLLSLSYRVSLIREFLVEFVLQGFINSCKFLIYIYLYTIPDLVPVSSVFKLGFVDF